MYRYYFHRFRHQKVNGYSPKQGTAAAFFELNCTAFVRVGGYSPKKGAADRENH